MRTTLAVACLLVLAACGSLETWWNGLPENAVRQPDGTWIGTENICWRGGGPLYETPGCVRRYRYDADGRIIERLD